MSNLLNIDTVSKGRVTDPSFIVLENNVKKYSNLFRNRMLDQNRFVPRDHILYKLLYSLGLQPYMDNELLRHHVKDKAQNIATSHRLTYYNNFGEISEDNFIPNTKEVLVLSTEPEGPMVKILHHNHYNLNFELGESNFSDGLAFIEINLFTLAKEYFRWVKCKTEDENVFNFLYMEGVYKLLPEYMDIALINRHFYNMRDIELPVESKNKLFSTPHIGDSVLTHIKTIKKHYEKKDLNMAGFFEHIPCVFKDTALDYLPVSPGWSTDQIRWVYELARLQYLNDALYYLEMRGLGKKDMNHLSQFKRYVKNFKMSKQISRLKKEDQSLMIPIINETDLHISALL